jgi:3-phosphoshikimate 1-carboxyvinyltransferase
MMSSLSIEPLSGPPHATVRVPGSKSITNRALVLATLTTRTQPFTLTGALRSEDTEVMVECLNALGFRVRPEWETATVRIEPVSDTRVIPAERADLFVANSGTTMRFLTAMVGLGRGHYRLHGVPRMHERPIGDLLEALRQLGVNAMSEKGNDCPPVIVESEGWRTDRVAVRGAVSSQFLSGLLLAAPFAARETCLGFDETIVSRPYLDMTEAMLHQWGFTLRFPERTGAIIVPAPQRANIANYAIEPDASAASYFFAAAAITGGRVRVPGLGASSWRGVVGFFDLV